MSSHTATFRSSSSSSSSSSSVLYHAVKAIATDTSRQTNKKMESRTTGSKRERNKLFKQESKHTRMLHQDIVANRSTFCTNISTVQQYSSTIGLLQLHMIAFHLELRYNLYLSESWKLHEQDDSVISACTLSLFYLPLSAETVGESCGWFGFLRTSEVSDNYRSMYLFYQFYRLYCIVLFYSAIAASMLRNLLLLRPHY